MKRDLELSKKYPEYLPCCPEEDPKGEPGVLLSDEIERYVYEFKLIDPFNSDNLKAASYQLTVGDEYAVGGKPGKLYDEAGKNIIKIRPFEVAVIKTKEMINMPRFLIGRWNIRVTKAYDGLLWVGGPQVDPGYVGHLYCPIYNLSNRDAILRLGEAIATIDFVRTTSFKKRKSKEYPRPPKRTKFSDYHPERVKSALFTEAGQKIKEAKDKIEKFGSKLDSFIIITLTIIAILIAALSILVTSGEKTSVSLPFWLYLSVILSIVAVVVSVSSRVKEWKDSWFKIIVIVYMILSTIAIIFLGAKVL